MTGYANWGYDNGEWRFVNSEAYKVISVEEPQMISKKLAGLSETIEVNMEVIPITLENSAGKQDTFYYIDVKANEQNREEAVRLAA